jgi:guanylate kinase
LANRFDWHIIPRVLITRPENEKTDNMTESQRNHQSEKELDNYKNFDYNIINEFGKLDATKEQLIAMIDREEILFDD